MIRLMTPQLRQWKEEGKVKYYREQMRSMRDDDEDQRLNASRTPLIASSFTAWRYQQMHEVVHFCASQDIDPPDFI